MEECEKDGQIGIELLTQSYQLHRQRAVKMPLELAFNEKCIFSLNLLNIVTNK